MKQNNEDFPYLILIPKFHKSPVTFRTINYGFSSYLVDANKAKHYILKSLLDKVLDSESSVIVRNSYQLIEKLNTLKNVQGIYAYDFQDPLNSIDISDLMDKVTVFFKNYKNSVNINYFWNLFKFVLKENCMHDSKNLYNEVLGIPVEGKL